MVNERKDFISKFLLYFKLEYNNISDSKDNTIIKYVPSLDGSISDIKYSIIKNRNNDIRLGSTTHGPHRDEYVFVNENGKKMTTYASQGQKRSAIISLKLAEKRFIESIRKTKPILIVDDVFSELDSKRRKNLINSVKEENQVFFTMVDVHKDIDEIFNNSLIVKIKNGMVETI